MSLRFDNGFHALSNVSLTLRQGEFVSIVGPSGCGKTTLLNMMAGLVRAPHTGHISVHGQAPALGTAKTAYMLARDCLLPWRTTLDNACYSMELRRVPKEAAHAKARKLLNAVGLTDFEKLYPKSLSHGMRQRVALVRTFALDSELLLMDEPFGALDAQTKVTLADILLRLWEMEKRTVVFVTHDLAEAIALSDRVIVMNSGPGRIVREMVIDLPRPRSVRKMQGNPHFHELYTSLWNSIDQSAHAHA
ncbi:ABC transporter ATP-binding protein [Variovorax dokdonensis]|uniref:ABC transporter ATP-binding protein n=1 Tax=Variovorax dokdonensis TaxID=344883 RepID=UPI00362C6EB7